MNLRFGSLCSGIEAASLAWLPLGWRCAWVAEIDPHCRSVLAHRYPDVPNLGDIRGIRTKWLERAGFARSIDVLVGGTPCQGFSVAGLRGGLADERSNLALEFLRVARRLRPLWVVWENVPGVFSSVSHDSPRPCPPPPPMDLERDGQEMETEDEYDALEVHAFHCFLPGLSELGYGYAYRTLDAQYFGLAQRRKRVFVVGYLGDWRPATAVLFERDCLSGHSAPRRSAKADVAGTITEGAHPSGFNGRDAEVGNVVVSFESNSGKSISTSPTIDSRSHSGPRRNQGGVIVMQPETVSFNIIGGAQSSPSHAYPTQTSGCLQSKGLTATGNEAGTLVAQPLAFQERGRKAGRNLESQSDLAYSLNSPNGGGRRHEMNIAHDMRVRRLTEIECERLQGLPDNWTNVPHKGKPMASGPRYRMVGNSIAVPVLQWIGRRLESVHRLAGSLA